MRASCDAILVGAATVRNDNPRLLVRSKTRRDERTARGLPPSPIKVTVTERVELDPCADFFTTGETEKLVYCASPRVIDARSRLGPSRPWSTPASRSRCARSAEDLAARGVERLMVEGGGKVHTQFLTDNLADELQLVVAPFFVGDSRAPRFVQRRPLPLEPRPASDARRGPPDRRRGAAALRALAAIPDRLSERINDASATGRAHARYHAVSGVRPAGRRGPR